VRAWSAPAVPTLPGSGQPLRLHDTATGEVRPTAPGPVARMYVCGITPYDATHIGHAATYVAFDLVARAWLDAGHDVHYVQNVTDVDDPLLERATRDGEDWRELAERETELFREDMTELRVLPPREYVGAVEAVPQITEAVGALRERGATYDLEGDVYFSVHSDPHFGSVGRLDDETMLAFFAERGGDPQRPGKKHPLDCLLWQSARPGEPSWEVESDLPAGRPGWHVECAAIALEHLGPTIDVQGGGSDLIFPHHEMSASEAQVLTGQFPFARHYVHAGMVGLDGEKMSKSRGNLVFVSALRNSDVDPMAIRLALMRHHYRADWEWVDAELWTAVDDLDRWRRALSLGAGAPAAPVVVEILDALATDLDAPRAVAAVDRWVAATLGTEGLADTSDPDAAVQVLTVLDAALGLAV
jgi:L-cysteine:1D-myo-inositol 2-amino-2-deoxy-alpha-D-glucopyranoside ligase